MRIIYLSILLSVLGLFSCQTEEPEMFTRERYIKFKFENIPGKVYYEIDYTFAFEGDNVIDKIIKVPVEFRGYNLTKALHFAVAVDKEKTTLPEDCYLLESEQLFQADSGCVDTMRVQLLRKPVLKEGSKILRLQLVSNEDFKTYMPDSLFVEITVGDVFMTPEWWNFNVEQSYLGKYSKTKYEEFVKETGIRDFGILDPSEKRYYAILFKRALEKNPRQDEDGSMMSVTITG